MKRAWPYAVALAVVVTACYLALAPLLRSVSPGPATSVSAILPTSNSTTVEQSKVVNFVSPQHGQTQLASDLPSSTKKKTATKATKKKKIVVSPDTGTSGFASPTPTQTTPTSPKKPAPKTKTGTAASKKGTSLGGGAIVQNQDGSAGLAGQGNDAGTASGGTKPVPSQ